MKVVKRNGKFVDFDEEKIRIAINKANATVMDSKRIPDRGIDSIIRYIKSLDKKRILVEDIQDIIEEKLMSKGYYELARNYITYRYSRAIARKTNTTDEIILGQIKRDFKDNANILTAANVRDLISSLISNDLSRRILLKEDIISSHDKGIIYFGGLDYYIEPMINYSYIDIGEMLLNGFVMNGIKVSTPKSLEVAVNHMIRIVLNILDNQYGKVVLNLSSFGKYINLSREKIINSIDSLKIKSVKDKENFINNKLKKEIESLCQMIIYEFNTRTLKNGKSLGVIFLLDTNNEYRELLEMFYKTLIDEKSKGILYEDDSYRKVVYPKLIYVLNEYTDYKYFNKVLKDNNELSFVSDNKYKSLKIGHFNKGEVYLNMLDIALNSKNIEDYYKLIDERLITVKEALICKCESLLGTYASISPIHYLYGGISRLQNDSKIDSLIDNNYSSLTIHILGLYESMCNLKLNNDDVLNIIKYLYNKVNIMEKELNLGILLDGTYNKEISRYFIDKCRSMYQLDRKLNKEEYYKPYIIYEKDLYKRISNDKEYAKYFKGGYITYINLSNNINYEKLLKYCKDNKGYIEFINK